MLSTANRPELRLINRGLITFGAKIKPVGKNRPANLIVEAPEATLQANGPVIPARQPSIETHGVSIPARQPSIETTRVNKALNQALSIAAPLQALTARLPSGRVPGCPPAKSPSTDRLDAAMANQ